MEPAVLPPRAVALALGADVRLRVTMAPSSGGGSFVVVLRGDVAPMMSARILALARSGYYSGLGWHRVEPDSGCDHAADTSQHRRFSTKSFVKTKTARLFDFRTNSLRENRQNKS